MARLFTWSRLVTRVTFGIQEAGPGAVGAFGLVGAGLGIGAAAVGLAAGGAGTAAALTDPLARATVMDRVLGLAAPALTAGVLQPRRRVPQVIAQQNVAALQGLAEQRVTVRKQAAQAGEILRLQLQSRFLPTTEAVRGVSAISPTSELLLNRLQLQADRFARMRAGFRIGYEAPPGSVSTNVLETNARLRAQRPQAQFEEAIRGGATGGAAAGIIGASAFGGPGGLALAAISTVGGGLIGQRLEEARMFFAEQRFFRQQLSGVERAQRETLAGFARQRERGAAARGLEIETRRDIGTELQRLLRATEQSYERQLRTTIQMEKARQRELEAIRSNRLAVGFAASQAGPFETRRAISQIERAFRGERVRFSPFAIQAIQGAPEDVRNRIFATQIQDPEQRRLLNLLGFGQAIREAREDLESSERLIERLQQRLAQERERFTDLIVENQRLLRVGLEQKLKDEVATGIRIQAQQVTVIENPG
jgi:hypothetical protein